MNRLKQRFMVALMAALVAMQLCAPASLAFAADSDAAGAAGGNSKVTVSADGKAATLEGADFALSDFSRAQKGTNSTVTAADGSEAYAGYRYYVAGTAGSVVAIGMSGYVVVYIPASVASDFGIQVDSASVASSASASAVDSNAQLSGLRDMLIALDEKAASGGELLSAATTWYFTSAPEYTVGNTVFRFDQEIKSGQFYACVIGADGSDITDPTNALYDKPTHEDSMQMTHPAATTMTTEATGLEAAWNFLVTLDWSPLWVTLKTTLVAIVFIFVLGLAAAYFTLHISPKAQNIFDSIFTIPMVLPPTVCGFVLLFLCGSKTPFGEFFINIGFPLIFSWPATVIAAVVVAFPLMYRNARGAFENLDPNMLDAAKTLGWSNQRIFFRLMLPLSWSSIAAATVLAFARALGEFGATLFLAGNYLGITRTIPIAIYFEWMNGNDAVAWFWVAIIIVFSFVVILFINLWSNHTTKYRRRDVR